MANALTSWKEIGQYLGKGVRTVQRWERETALPVRRPANARRGSVLAYPEELDTWTRTRMKGPGVSVVEALVKEVAMLRQEVGDLRSRVLFLESGAIRPGRVLALRSESLLVLPLAPEPAPARETSPAHVLDHPSAAVRDALSVSRDRTTSEQARFDALVIRSQTVRLRIDFTLALLDIAETCSEWGKPRRNEDSLRRARHSAKEIASCLEVPGYVSDSELQEFRSLSSRVESRIRRLTFRGSPSADRMPVWWPENPGGGRFRARSATISARPGARVSSASSSFWSASDPSAG